MFKVMELCEISLKYCVSSDLSGKMESGFYASVLSAFHDCGNFWRL
jgi:hypothetical protein